MRMLQVVLLAALVARPCAVAFAQSAEQDQAHLMRYEYERLERELDGAPPEKALRLTGAFVEKWMVAPDRDDLQGLLSGLTATKQLHVQLIKDISSRKAPSRLGHWIDRLALLGTREQTDREAFRAAKSAALADIALMNDDLKEATGLLRRAMGTMGTAGAYKKINESFQALASYCEREREFQFHLSQMGAAALPAHDIVMAEKIRDFVVGEAVKAAASAGVGAAFSGVTSRLGMLLISGTQGVAGAAASGFVVGDKMSGKDFASAFLKDAVKHAALEKLKGSQ